MAVQTPPSFSISCRQMSCHMDYFPDAFVKRRGQTCFKISFSFIGLREASRAAASAKEPWLSNWLATSAMWTSCKHTVSDRMEHQGIGYCSRLKKAPSPGKLLVHSFKMRPLIYDCRCLIAKLFLLVKCTPTTLLMLNIIKGFDGPLRRPQLEHTHINSRSVAARPTYIAMMAMYKQCTLKIALLP